jgi:tripartite-type tricarboxylate transporter receptor subunit TctC
LEVIGGACLDSVHSQDNSFQCEDHRPVADAPMMIIVTSLSKNNSQQRSSKKKNKNPSFVSFSIDQIGSTFTLKKEMFSNSKMESIRIEIFDKSGEIVYQILEVDASCKSVFATTDQFGAIKVLNYSNRKQGFVGCV